MLKPKATTKKKTRKNKVRARGAKLPSQNSLGLETKHRLRSVDPPF